MNTEQLQQRHNDLQQRLIATRERIRQTEAQLQELANNEQQLLGAIAIVREFIQMPPVESPAPATVSAPLSPLPADLGTIDNAAQ